MIIRLFTSGTHNGLTFSNQDIEDIFKMSNGSEVIPFVIGHPKNDLPIVGKIDSKKLRIYSEGNKRSIGFSRNDAEFSEESIQVLKKLKKDKISIRLYEGVIKHIGLVDDAAVRENNYQEFSMDNKTGLICFSDNFDFDAKANDDEPNWFKTFTDKFFNSNKHKQDNMDTAEKKALTDQIATLTKKIEDFENKEKQSGEKSELEKLQAKVQEFENKEKTTAKAELKAKVDTLKLDDAGAKAKMDFGNSLIDTNIDLAKKWIAELAPVEVSGKVKQGSVTGEETQEDFAKKDPYKKAVDEAKKQIESQKQA